MRNLTMSTGAKVAVFIVFTTFFTYWLAGDWLIEETITAIRELF